MNEDSNVDRLIWKYVGEKSMADIADLTGLSVEQVGRRKDELFQAIDVLTVQQRMTKILVNLAAIAREAEEAAAMAKAGGNEGLRSASGLYNSAVNAQKVLLQQLERIRKEDTSQVDQLNALRIKEIAQMYGRVVDKGIERLVEVHGLDAGELHEMFMSLLPEAAAEIES